MGEYEGRTNADLIRLLDDRGIDRTGLRKNADYVEALRADDRLRAAAGTQAADAVAETEPATAVQDATAAPQDVEAPTAEVAAAEEIVAPQEHESLEPVRAHAFLLEPNPLDVPAPYPTGTDMSNRLVNAGLG